MLNDPGTELWAAKRNIMDPGFSKAFLRTTIDDLNKVANSLIANLGIELSRIQLTSLSTSLKVHWRPFQFCGKHLKQRIETKERH